MYLEVVNGGEVMLKNKMKINIESVDEDNNLIKVSFEYEPSGYFSFNNLTYYINDERSESETYSSLYEVNLRKRNIYTISLDYKKNCSSIYFRLKDRETNEYYGVRVFLDGSKTKIKKEEK